MKQVCNHFVTQRISTNLLGLYGKLDMLAPIGFLLLRVWVAYAFWKSGYLKLTNWDSTLYLFENEYAVPLLSPELAAYLATFTELVFPALLIIGLASRMSAFVLFVFNIIAVISYPALEGAGIRDHQIWGLMLLVITFSGPGLLSLDHWIKHRFRNCTIA